MNSFLLTWNPRRYSQYDLNTSLDDYDAGGEFNWNITAHRQAKEEDIVFFYNQGPAPNGIFASGTISGTANTIGRSKRQSKVLSNQVRSKGETLGAASVDKGRVPAVL